MNGKIWVMSVSILIMGVFVFVGMYSGIDFGLTGHVVSGGDAELDIGDLNVIAVIGESRYLAVNVKNVGGVFAYECALVTNDGYGDYFESSDLHNISVGKTVEFMFLFNSSDEDVVDLALSVECLDGVSGEVPLNIVVWESGLDDFIAGDDIASRDSIVTGFSLLDVNGGTSYIGVIVLVLLVLLGLVIWIIWKK